MVMSSASPALLIWHWWQAGRVTRNDLARLAPFFAVALVITALDLSFYTSREPLSLGYSFVERTLIAARALWFYVGKLLWPTDLAVIYPLWEIDAADPLAWAYVLAAAALLALLWFGRPRFGRGPVATPPERLAVAVLDEMLGEDDPVAVRAVGVVGRVPGVRFTRWSSRCWLWHGGGRAPLHPFDARCRSAGP